MKRTKPPFRADHVGSFLRPAALKEARTKREKGALTAVELKAVEDREIEKVIKRQEELGLQLATDGEFRRSWWHFDFLGMLDGVEIYEAEQGIQFHGVQTKAQGLRIVGKVGFSHDLGNAYKQAVKAFYDAGCRYLQFDDTVWAYLCSQEELRKARERMSNVDQLQAIYARVLNTALEAKPADMTITTHVCRGNFRSTWISEGGYEPVAVTLLGKVNYDGYFLEYDTERAGGFEPLRFLPKGNKVVVLGLV